MNKKLSMACLSLLLAAFIARADKPVSVSGNFNGHGYELVPTASTWHLAKRKADRADGYLVVISSEAENQFVLDLQKKATKGAGCDVWIGLNDEKNEGAWEWVNGEKVCFVKWSKGEPNNFGYGFMGGSEHSVHMNTVGEWNDYGSDGRIPFVIEYDHEISSNESTDTSSTGGSKIRSTR